MKKTYRGYKEADYKEVMKQYAEKMFNLFDEDDSYNSNKGSSLMWLGTFTASLIACDVIDTAISKNKTLFEALIIELQKLSPNRSEDLEKLLSK